MSVLQHAEVDGVDCWGSGHGEVRPGGANCSRQRQTRGQGRVGQSWKSRSPPGTVVAVDPTFGELLDRWIAHVRSLGRPDATLYHYEQYIKREIKPVFGMTRLSKINALDLDRFYSGLTARGLAPTTVRQIHAIMRASLIQGERWGMVGRNVAK